MVKIWLERGVKRQLVSLLLFETPSSYAKVETLEKHTSEVHRRKSNVQIEGICLNDQTNESQPPKAKKTKFEPSVISDNKAIPPIAVYVQTAGAPVAFKTWRGHWTPVYSVGIICSPG